MMKLIASRFSNCVALVAALSVAFAPAHSSEARSKAILRKEASQELRLAQAVLGGVNSRKATVNMLANAGVAVEPLRMIDADLAKRMPEGAITQKLTIEKDEIFVDGKASGIQITSYSPLKIKFQGKSWSLSENKSADENYFALIRFLEYKKTASAISLLLPQANALFENGTTGLFSGLTIGMLGGGIFGLAFGFDPLMSMFVGAGAGALFGYMYGKSNEPTQFPPYVPGQAYPAAR